MHAADSSDTPSVKMSSGVIVKVYKQALPLSLFFCEVSQISLDVDGGAVVYIDIENRSKRRWAGDECENLNLNRVFSPSK